MDSASLLDKAFQHEQDQRFDRALETYQRALALDPANAEIHNSMGIVCERLDHPDLAEQHYRSALELGPTNRDVHYNLGMLYRQQGRKAEAQAVLEEFLTLAREPGDIREAKALLKQETSQSYEKCMQCGVISTLGSLFRGTSKGKVCPRCYAQSSLRRAGIGLLVGVALQAVGAVLFYFPMPSLHYLTTNLLLMYVLAILLVLPHELCHAAATRLAGGSVFEIRLGLGSVLWEKRFGGFILSLGKVPVMGLCIGGFPSRQYLRERALLAVSAGPLFNLLLVVLAVPFFAGSRLLNAYAPVEVFVLANAFALLVNLLPRQVERGGIRVPTDGLQLLQLLSGSFPVDEAHLGFFLNRGMYAMRREMPSQALAACEDGLAAYPTSTLLRNLKAWVLLEMEQHEEARTVLEKLLSHFQSAERAEEPGIKAETRPLMEAILLNNAAYSTALTNLTPEALDQAYGWARQAYRMTPWIPSIQGTLGSVLVEMGQIKEGIRHLMLAFEHHEEARGKASVLAYAAIGHSRQGDAEKAASLLAEAKALKAGHYMVRKAEAEIRANSDP